MSYLHRAGLGGMILGATLAITSPAHGDASHDQARQVLSQADADLTGAQRRADSAQELLDVAKDRAAQVAAHLDDERNAAKEIRERLSRGEAAIPDIQKKIDSAAARKLARQKEMISRDLKYAPLKFADDQARLDAIGEFESSPQRRASLAAVADQATAVRTVEARARAGFSGAAEYRQAADAMRAADAAVNAARAKNPGDQEGIASATKSAADAHAALDALCERRLAGDPNVLIARARLADTKKNADELRSRFMNEQLPDIPKVKLADGALKGEQANYDVLTAAVNTADADGATAQAVMDRQKAGLAADHATLDRMSAEIAQLETQSANAQADVDRAGKSLQIAVAYLTSSEQSRANAQAALDQLDAPAAEPLAPPVYAYDPTPPIYYQSGPIYVGRPYYGSIYITPARGPIFGFNPARGGYQGRPSDHQGHFHGNGGHRR